MLMCECFYATAFNFVARNKPTSDILTTGELSSQYEIDISYQLAQCYFTLNTFGFSRI